MCCVVVCCAEEGCVQRRVSVRRRPLRLLRLVRREVQLLRATLSQRVLQRALPTASGIRYSLFTNLYARFTIRSTLTLHYSLPFMSL